MTPPTTKLPKNKLRLLYVEILNGYSQGTIQNRPFFIKHFTSSDLGEVDLKYDNYYEKAVSDGLPSLEEREKFLLQEGLWTAEKDTEIIDLKEFLSRLKVTKSKLFRKEEIDRAAADIEKYSIKLKKITEEKDAMIELTAEGYATRKINQFYLYSSLFEDRELKYPLFSQEEFDELEDDIIGEFSEYYFYKIGLFNNTNLKRIALSPFFFNLFCVSEGVWDFFGKPLISLTFYQADLYSNARFFKSLVSDSPNRPDDSLFEDPDKLLEWYEINKSADSVIGKNKEEKTLVGLSREDRERLGYNDDNNPNNKIAALAMKNGGSLDFAGIMRAVGIKE